VLERWGIRLATSLVGICAGLILSSALIDGFKMNLTSLIQATLIFWGVHFFVQVVALRTLIRQPSVALAGLLALAATVIALDRQRHRWRAQGRRPQQLRTCSTDHLDHDRSGRHCRHSQAASSPA